MFLTGKHPWMHKDSMLVKNIFRKVCGVGCRFTAGWWYMGLFISAADAVNTVQQPADGAVKGGGE